MNIETKINIQPQNINNHKKTYTPPRLINYGEVRSLTQNGTMDGLEVIILNPRGMALSDRNTKENIAKIGVHPLGIGLYLFDYKPEYREQWGHGRQFGVMADEVETVMPAAVSVHPEGYKQVNYGMLGINRTVH
jgi:hypothetical protein